MSLASLNLQYRRKVLSGSAETPSATKYTFTLLTNRNKNVILKTVIATETTFYHQWVERVLTTAYNSALGDVEVQKQRVKDALSNIGRSLQGMSF